MKIQVYSDHTRSFKSIIAVTILSAMLCTFSAKAGYHPAITFNAVTTEVKTVNDTKGCFGANTEMNFEALADELCQEVEYNAGDFVNSEIALEFENWIYSDSESYDSEVFADITLPLEYRAKDFIEAELSDELKNQELD